MLKQINSNSARMTYDLSLPLCLSNSRFPRASKPSVLPMPLPRPPRGAPLPPPPPRPLNGRSPADLMVHTQTIKYSSQHTPYSIFITQICNDCIYIKCCKIKQNLSSTTKEYDLCVMLNAQLSKTSAIYP